jgi:hypothetical protein
MTQLKPWLLLAGAVLVLAACGGGGGGDDTGAPVQSDPLDGVPVEATQSVSGWISYLTKVVMASDADGRDPAALPSGAPSSLPVDDESEPVAL